MKFVTLKSFDKKKLLIPTLIITSLILVITIFVSHAEFTSTDHVTIVDGVINYTPYDFKMMAMYEQKEECLDPSSDTCYKEVEVMPSKGYYIDEEKSYCYKTNPKEKITGKVYTNNDGEHVIKDLEKNTKCILYFGTRSFNTLSKLKLVSNGETAHFDGTSCNETCVPYGVSNVCSSGCSYQENGIYEVVDDDGTSYFFRGTVENNYVKFGQDKTGADIWWRIIRINGNGSIRMIYAGTSTNGNAPAQTGLGTAINNGEYYAFNNSWDKAEYVGYQYTLGQRNGNEKDSNAKTVLENWFKENLIEEYEAGYIDKNTGFCGDRTVYSGTGVNQEPTIYSPSKRNRFNESTITQENPATPSYLCEDKEHDLYTIKEAKEGTKTLTYPIGLITADEITTAGGVGANPNFGYYLYNSIISWSISPYSFNGYSIINFGVYDNGHLAYLTGGSAALRPVINITAGALTKGNGIASNPFTTD